LGEAIYDLQKMTTNNNVDRGKVKRNHNQFFLQWG